MCTRGVWQLSSVTVRFCAQGGSSAGTRAFVAGDLRAFAAANSAIGFAVEHVAGRHPLAVGRYRALARACARVCLAWRLSHLSSRAAPAPPPLHAGDGTVKPVDLRNKDAAAVAAVLQSLRDNATGRVRRFRQPVRSQVPSVQGVWDPSSFEGDADLLPLREARAGGVAAEAR